jgi:hypothetical protein
MFGLIYRVILGSFDGNRINRACDEDWSLTVITERDPHSKEFKIVLINDKSAKLKAHRYSMSVLWGLDLIMVH